MAQNITLMGASYSDVPSVQLPKTGGGTASFTDVTDTTAVAGDVAQGKYFFSASGVLTLGTNQGGSGDGSVWQDANGYVHLSDEAGTHVEVDALTVTQGGTYTAQTGHAYSPVTVASGSAGTPTATKGSVSNHSISVTPSVTNTSGYITGSTINGTAVTVSASELVSGTLTVDSSGTKDVTNYASASVPSGTAGTPSASKGAVSNHSISVTPSVTNLAGWISSGTKTGTAVTVSASELVSGTKSISSNGSSIDVTEYASVNVSVPTVTITQTGSNLSIV